MTSDPKESSGASRNAGLDWIQAPEEAQLHRTALEAGRRFSEEARKTYLFEAMTRGVDPWRRILPDGPNSYALQIGQAGTALQAMAWGPFGEAHIQTLFGLTDQAVDQLVFPLRTDILPRRIEERQRRRPAANTEAEARNALAWVKAMWELIERPGLGWTRPERLIGLFEWIAIDPAPPSGAMREALIRRLDAFMANMPEIFQGHRDRLDHVMPYVLDDEKKIHATLEELFDRCQRDGVTPGRTRWELMRHGRLLYRRGKRKLALRCLRLLGHRLETVGWHREPRIFRRRPGLPLEDPVVATHPLMAGAWMNPANRPQLVEVFRQAESAPWIFDRLHPAFEWQMTMAGRDDVLAWIDRID